MDPPESEETPINLKIILTPWKTKEEFIGVYNDLFADDANLDSKKRAFEMLLMWRIRRCDGTPASVLSTLELLNVELKRNNLNLSGELQTMYSDAFTKFINNMTSVTQVKQFKTLYSSAKELGLQSFLIDLRHICAHGQTSPSMDVLLRSATYCMNWLKEFYWDRQLELVANVSVQDLRSKKSLAFENYIKELYRIYDIATEAIHKGYETVEDKIFLHDGTSSLDVLRSYAEEAETTDLDEVRQIILKNCSSVIRKECSLRQKYEIVSKIILFDSHYFLVSPNIKRKSKLSPIELYQSLFRALASVGALEELFRCVIRVMENFDETETRRKGAAYWSLHILNGLSMMKKFKRSVFKRVNQNPSFKINKKLVNKESHSIKLKKIYDDWNATPSNTLLFCDTDNWPIQLRIKKNFLRTRLLKVDEISKEFCLRCFEEVEPPLTTNEVDSLKCLLNSYSPKVEDLLLNGEKMDDEPDNDDINTTEMFEKRSWRTSNDINWSQVAFGASPRFE